MPRPLFHGTPAQVADGLQAWFESGAADGLQAWFESGAADGFIINGGTPDTFERFVDEVVPVLQARGLTRREYPGRTLRDSFALPKPVNQFTLQ